MSRSIVVRTLAGAAVVGGLVTSASAASRAFVTPHAVFMSETSPSTQVTVGASGDEPEEITVDLQFGFPDVDADGKPFVRLIQDPGPEFPSAAGWIRPFPRRFRLEPNQQQVVRLLATPPDSLPDGEYWTRMIITSRGLTAPVIGGDSVVQAGLQLVIRLITSVTYRKGDVRTAFRLDGLSAEGYPDSVVAMVEGDHDGNGAYLGMARFELVGTDGAVVQEWPIPIAVYFPFRRRFVLPLDEPASGDFQLRLTVEVDREDLPEGGALAAPAVRDSIPLPIP